jgi:hypothetical protein
MLALCHSLVRSVRYWATHPKQSVLCVALRRPSREGIDTLTVLQILCISSLFFWSSSAFAQDDVIKQMQRQFITAKDGAVIELPEGTFNLQTSLWLDGKNNIIIRGKGKDKTILNFTNQISGAEGIKITNGTNITLQNFTVQDTKGDAIKTQFVNGIIFLNVKAEWTRGANSKNGGYGLYPVQCSNVVIKTDCS